MKQSRSIAIITARGGSKRIPRKNIRDFLGKPIIAYSIEAALESKLFDEVMVSTDDEEIAKISKEFGAKVPFRRSAGTSDDRSTTADALIEVINRYRDSGQIYDYACCIYPTAPFINETILTNARDLLMKNNFDSVFPVCRFGSPIQRALKMDSNSLVSMIYPENLNKRSQDLEPAYHDAGQFYFFNVQQFLKTGKLWTERSGAIVLNEMQAQDIDNEEDWQVAEFKYEFQKRKG